MMWRPSPVSMRSAPPERLRRMRGEIEAMQAEERNPAFRVGYEATLTALDRLVGALEPPPPPPASEPLRKPGERIVVARPSPRR